MGKNFIISQELLSKMLSILGSSKPTANTVAEIVNVVDQLRKLPVMNENEKEVEKTDKV